MWFRYYRDPNKNPRMGQLVLDLTGAELKNFNAPIDVALDAVYEITKNHPAPYTLLVSGGVDSQAMIHVWKQSGVPFKVVHYNYLGLNAHDTQFLVEFCQQQEVECNIIDFDAVGFITSNLLKDYAKKYDCSSPQILTYIRFAEQHSETAIMSGNFHLSLSIGVNYTLLALDRFRKESKPNFIPFFFSSTPSLTFLTKYLKKSQINDGYQFKCNAYNQLGVAVIQQPAKYTGFEKIKELFDHVSVPTELRMRYKNYPSKRPFDLLYRYALYDHITLYNDRLRLII